MAERVSSSGPVAGPVRVEAETIVGDGVADRVNHGGPDKAVLGYAADHYLAWRLELDVAAEGGAFGENLTIAGQAEADVCVGDVYAVGRRRAAGVASRGSRAGSWAGGGGGPTCRRGSCETGRTGWYFRVRPTGELAAGDAVRLVDRPHAGLTVAALNDMLYGRRPATAAACDCPALAGGWRRQLRTRLGATSADPS